MHIIVFLSISLYNNESLNCVVTLSSTVHTVSDVTTVSTDHPAGVGSTDGADGDGIELHFNAGAGSPPMPGYYIRLSCAWNERYISKFS